MGRLRVTLTSPVWVFSFFFFFSLFFGGDGGLSYRIGRRARQGNQTGSPKKKKENTPPGTIQGLCVCMSG